MGIADTLTAIQPSHIQTRPHLRPRPIPSVTQAVQHAMPRPNRIRMKRPVAPPSCARQTRGWGGGPRESTSATRQMHGGSVRGVRGWNWQIQTSGIRPRVVRGWDSQRGRLRAERVVLLVVLHLRGRPPALGRRLAAEACRRQAVC